MMASLNTGAASDLLEGLSMYGGEKSPYGKYAQQASSYLDSYGQKHEVPGAHSAAKPPAGKFQNLSCTVFSHLLVVANVPPILISMCSPGEQFILAEFCLFFYVTC